MTTQPEQILENNLVKQLTGLNYTYVHINNEEGILANLKSQLEFFNETTFSEKEFSAILNHLAKSNVFEKAKNLRDRFQLNCDNGESFYVCFYNSEDCS
jgi:type I restriction enzyme R subunit